MKPYKPTHQFEIHLHSDREEDVKMVAVDNGEIVTDGFKSMSDRALFRLSMMLMDAGKAFANEIDRRNTDEQQFNPNKQ